MTVEQRQAQFRRFNAWLVRLHEEAPVSFHLFSAGVAFILAAVILLLVG